MCNELIRDVRDMIAGFLKNNRMEHSAAAILVGFLRAGPGFTERQTVLMMHEKVCIAQIVGRTGIVV